jgi:iron complex transport system ATP-binding protein
MVKTLHDTHFSAHNISLTINNKPILNSINLSIQSGKITGLLGPNGAGKTSLLRILSGEWAPTNGEVKFLNQPLKEWSALELGKRRAFLHQESNLDFAFTVLEVVLLGRSPHMKSSERPIDYSVAEEALQAVELSERKNEFFTSLSGGEKQRVHLARCLAQVWNTSEAPKERCLFLDEPTNNLDLEHQYAVFSVARKAAEEGMAVVVVLHDLNQAFQFCDELFILEKGHLALQGEPSDLINNPRLADIFKVQIEAVNLRNSHRPFMAITPR